MVAACPGSAHTMPDGFASYNAYVQALSRQFPDFEWLARFFSHRPQVLESKTRVTILDSEDGILKTRRFSLDTLAVPPRPGTTRLVILSYQEVWSIERYLLDAVAMALNLPPYFLSQHLQYEYNTKEKSAPLDPDATNSVLPLPRGPGSLSLEVGLSEITHLSGMIAPWKGKPRGTTRECYRQLHSMSC